MRYSLTGFVQDVGYRVFAFECVADDRSRTAFRVRADLALSRRYGIHIQELPLLCQGVLERRDASEITRAFTYTEAEMCVHATAVRDAAALKKKPARRPAPSENVGAAWRGLRV